ncbi:uncharacterized protein B0I36DRAFT_315227 [Microdochium trichocladiopsis]|uniref:Uncharacterized protein n=1 Tax=Microdochium trichocladiopsis TaxID=1682393 RepID=A0A9P8YFI4_9PEZI|nr:uncharacterized protein B0I36DRAFT_315227 [Microdochium trichocladiopsis]KAH7037987.1 hypothetical protein B0I36DRAFT_315227 [Microdochium trichocladiopsis]
MTAVLAFEFLSLPLSKRSQPLEVYSLRSLPLINLPQSHFARTQSVCELTARCIGGKHLVSHCTSVSHRPASNPLPDPLTNQMSAQATRIQPLGTGDSALYKARTVYASRTYQIPGADHHKKIRKSFDTVGTGNPALAQDSPARPKKGKQADREAAEAVPLSTRLPVT